MHKKNRVLLIVILLAAFLRFYQLGVNPPSLDWDEASLGYNAYSLLKTGRDEFGRSWPVSIRSFEDYKPAMYTYLTIVPVAIFGLNEFAVRLPSAVFGTLTIFVVYFLIYELQRKEMLPSWNSLPFVVALLLSISPWHLQFSRVAFESNVSLFFVLSGVMFFLKALDTSFWFVASGFFFVLSFYTYHSPRLVVPLLIIGWSLYFWKKLFLLWKPILISMVIAGIILIPFIHELATSGRARLSSVTVLTPQGTLDESIQQIDFDKSRNDWLGPLIHNRRIIYTLLLAKGYLDHFNLDFLFLTGDAPDRHHARDMGVLYAWEAPFVFLGMIYVFKRKGAFLLFWWFLVAPAASAITTGTPHPVRAYLYLPLYQIFTGVGILQLSKYVRHMSELRFGIIAISSFLVFINIFYYFQMYYVHTPIEASNEWQYGYKQAVEIARRYENEVNKIVITYAYDQPHVFVLFYNQVDPTWYQAQWRGEEIKRDNRTFGKYEFRKIDWEKDQYLTNTLFIGTPGEIPQGTPLVAEVPFLNGNIAFRITKR